MKTAQVGPRTKAAVAASAPGVDAEAPRPTASEEPKESKIVAFVQCSSRPRLFSWLHMDPEELMDQTLERSHRPGSASRASSMGVEKAKPTMTTPSACNRSTSFQSSTALNPREGRVATAPP